MTAASQPPAPSHAHDRQDQPFISLGVGIVTVSDSRTLETDRSGKLLEDTLQAAGHRCVLRIVVPDVVKQIQAQGNDFSADDRVHTILVTGGTGVTPRDVTPEKIAIADDFSILYVVFVHLWPPISYGHTWARMDQYGPVYHLYCFI